MPISLTCSCGARLDIDDKFVGKSIACPDCNKPLSTEPPAPPPTRTSGLAVLSLVLATVGAFTIVGTLAAVACGAVAYRQLTRKRGSTGGVRLAQAGMILGAAFTVIAIVAYSSKSLVAIDSLARQYVWAGKLKYEQALTVTKKGRGDDVWLIDRPSQGWGRLDTAMGNNKESDHLLLVNVRDDAHILWLSETLQLGDDHETKRSKALECFRASDLVRLIGRVPDNASGTDKIRDVDDTLNQFVLDIPLGGVPRTFLFRLHQKDHYVNILVCGARAGRFDALKSVFLDAVNSFKSE